MAKLSNANRSRIGWIMLGILLGVCFAGFFPGAIELAFSIPGRFIAAGKAFIS